MARTRRAARPTRAWGGKPRGRPRELAHAVFLNRVTYAPPTDPSVRLAQAGFLALRFADLFARDHEPVEHDVFHYQLVATERYCKEVEEEGPEARYLLDICAVGATAYRTRRLEGLRAVLGAYGSFLEERGSDEEAADVFRTAARAVHEGEESGAAQFWARAGRAFARAGRWEAAEEAYRAARRGGDPETRLLARAGIGDVLRRRGQVEEAIVDLEAVLRAAQRARSVTAERAAALGLARAVAQRGEPVAAALHAWSAVARSQSDAERAEAALELGGLLEEVGALDAAASAYALVQRHPNEVDRRAEVGLLRVSAARGDRVTFERWRRTLTSLLTDPPHLPPGAQLEIVNEVGRGLARFGQRAGARRALGVAVELERELGLVGRSAALERELDRLARGGVAPKPEPLPEALAPVVTGLEKLVAQGRGRGRRGGEAVP